MMDKIALFQLVATLSPSEKRHFRVFAARHVIGEANNYLSLFDAVAAHDGGSKEDFLRRHADAPFAKNFNYNAHYLYQLVLRSLQSYAYEGTAEAALRSLLDKVELLMGRQLLDLAAKQLRVLLRDAYALEEFAVALQALQLQRRLLRRASDRQQWVGLPEIHEKIEELLRLIANEEAILASYDQVFLATQNRLNLRDDAEAAALDALLAQPVLQDPGHAATFNGRIAWHFTHAFIHTLRGQHALAAPHYQRIVHIWEAHPQQVAHNPERYALTIVDLLNCCHHLERYEDFEAGFQAIRSLPKLPERAAQRLGWIVANLEVLYLLNTLKLDEAGSAIDRWELAFNQSKGVVSENGMLSFSFNIALLHFIKEDFRMAQRWLHRILNHPRTLARGDIQRFSRVFQLVLQVETGQFEQLETGLSSTRRSLRQAGINALEAAMLRLLQRLVYRPRSEWGGHLQAFCNTLHRLGKGQGAFFGLQEMLLWAESRRHGRSLADQLRLQSGG